MALVGSRLFARRHSSVRLVELGLGLGQIGLGTLEGRLGVVHLGLVGRVVDQRQHRPFVDHRAEIDDLLLGRIARVDAEGLDLPDHLGADVDDLLRLDRSGGGDGRPQVAAADLGSAEWGWVGGACGRSTTPRLPPGRPQRKKPVPFSSKHLHFERGPPGRNQQNQSLAGVERSRVLSTPAGPGYLALPGRAGGSIPATGSILAYGQCRRPPPYRPFGVCFQPAPVMSACRCLLASSELAMSYAPSVVLAKPGWFWTSSMAASMFSSGTSPSTSWAGAKM